MKLLFVKVAHYPDFDLPKICHGCGFNKSNGMRKLINHTSNETCVSPTHMCYWELCNTKKHNMSSKRYLTGSFLKELKAKGQLLNYECILYLICNVIHNAAYNYLSSYKLNMEHFEEIKKLVAESTKTKFYLYKRLCKWVCNSQVTEGKCLFAVEIDAEQNRGLVEDLNKKLYESSWEY